MRANCFSCLATFTLLFTFFNCGGNAVSNEENRMKNNMYHIFPSSSYGHCFRRMNGTAQTGCSADNAVGVLTNVITQEDLDSALSNTKDNIILVLTLESFIANKTIVNQLLGKPFNHIAGLFLLHDKNQTRSTAPKYSSDASCPDSTLSLYSKQGACDPSKGGVKWNDAAIQEVGLVLRDLPFPFVVVQKSEQVNQVLDCLKKFGSKVSRWNQRVCAAKIHLRMSAVKDSVVCLRRQNLAQYQLFVPKQFCAAVGDFNLAITAQNVNTNRKEKSVVALITRMDSLSLYQGASPGAASAISGLITVMAAAEALVKSPDIQKSDTDVLVMLLNAESLDYIGSSRAIYEMESTGYLVGQGNISTINMTNLKSVIEVSQIGDPDQGKLYIHADGNSSSSQKLAGEAVPQQQGSVKLSVASVSKTAQLPPASVQTFLRKKPDLPAIVIADHKEKFRNKFYHSVLDTDFELSSNIETMTDVATTVAKIVYQQSTGKTSTNLKVDNKTIVKLLDCYLKDVNCELISSLASKSSLKTFKDLGAPLPSMPNIYGDRQSIPLTFFTQSLAGFLWGNKLDNVTQSACNTMAKAKSIAPLQYLWVPGFSKNGTRQPFCYSTRIMKTSAVSPALSIAGYDWGKAEPYPTWTESYWDSPDVRIFLMASRTWEITVFVIGLLVFLTALILTYFISQNLEKLFPGDVATEEQPLAAHT